MKSFYIYDILCFVVLLAINALIIIAYHGIKDILNEKKSLPSLVALFFWSNKKPKVYILFIIALLTLSIERIFGRNWDALLIAKVAFVLLTLTLLVLSLLFHDIPDEEQMKQIKKYRKNN